MSLLRNSLSDLELAINSHRLKLGNLRYNGILSGDISEIHFSRGRRMFYRSREDMGGVVHLSRELITDFNDPGPPEPGAQLNHGSFEDRLKRVTQEDVSIVPYDPAWPRMFEGEKRHLLASLPRELIRRIEHFGSTAIPNLAAKPIVDILVEVASLEETKRRIVPALEAQGYDYFWRPTHSDDGPPLYAWFIKRDAAGIRTHHIHMVESHFEEHWDRLLFRDYLIEHPETAKEYEALKLNLARDYQNDRVAYTNGKTEFIVRVTQAAKEYYQRV